MKKSPKIPFIEALLLFIIFFQLFPLIPVKIEARKERGPIDFAVTKVTWKKASPDPVIKENYNVSTAFEFVVEGKIRNRNPYPIKYHTPNLNAYDILIDAELRNKSLSIIKPYGMYPIIPTVNFCFITPGITDVKNMNCDFSAYNSLRTFLYFKENITGSLPLGTYYVRIVGENSKLNGYIYGAIIVSSNDGIKVTYEKPFEYEYYMIIYWLNALLASILALFIIIVKKQVKQVKI